MRKFIFAFIGLFIICLGLLILLPGLVPSSAYKDKIESQLSKEVGRNVLINGDIKIASFPFIRAKTTDVIIENYAGFKSNEFIKIEELEAKIRLLPLFSKRVEIEGFNLIGANIYLERNGNGDVNWIDPTKPAANTIKSSHNNDAFKRDGRFTSFNPQIGAFNIINGRFVFLDDLNNQNYEADEVNGRLSLASLNSPLIANMSLTYQGDPLEITLKLDTPESFLNGKKTPFGLSATADFASFEVKGSFLNSENINIIADVKADISDIARLSEYFPEKIPYLELLNSGRIEGNISYIDEVLNIKNSSAGFYGDHINADYKGNILLSETPALSGELTANVANPKALADALSPYLDTPLPQAELLGETSLTASFSSDGTNTKADQFSLNTQGDTLSGNFNGQGQYSKDGVTLSGDFDTSVRDVQSVAKSLNNSELESYATLLGPLNAKGQMVLIDQSLTLKNLQTNATGGDINGAFTGNIVYNEAPKIDGTFDVNIPDFLSLDKKLNLDSAYSASVKKIEAEGVITTDQDILSISDLSADLSEGLINAQFDGKANYALKTNDALSLSGTLVGNIEDIRKLAALNGTELPSDTDIGDIFETAAFSGIVTGTTKTLSMSDMKLAFDDLKGTGNLNITMESVRPLLKATLDLEGLDLRPYMASYSAQNPTGEIQPWSEAPFNVDAFKALDGSIVISTPNIITDRLSLGQSDIKANIKNGVLQADIPNLFLYGGGGQGDLTFDASKPIPELTFNVSLNSLNGEGFLGAVAGFTKIIGSAGTELSVKASGTSQASLMRSLNGQGQFGLTGGQIKGIDIVKFTTGLDEAFRSRSLPGGLGVNEVTSFEALKGLFSINNGVVSINEFDVSASGVSAKGLGKIDLGQQQIDFKLRPKLNNENAKGIAAFGIPLQFSGGFGNASASLDTDFLGQIVQEKAKAKLADTVRGKVKGPVGGILNSIIDGGQVSTQTPPTPPEGAESQSQPTLSGEETINNVIGGLFGNTSQSNKPNTPSPEVSKTQDEVGETEQTKTEDEKDKKNDIEKALGSLFGD